MRSPTANQLLNAWEQGLAQSPVLRTLTMLSLTSDEESLERLAKVSLGRRDSQLLTLREDTFGPAMQGQAICPSCLQQLEIDFAVGDLRVGFQGQNTGSIAVDRDGYQVTCRVLNSGDLLVASLSTNPRAARESLLHSCILESKHNHRHIPADQLPAEVVSHVIATISEADPQSNIELSLTCIECSYEWQVVFDIASFLWSELNAWACKILREVHVLAHAYGWCEAEILALSPGRRRLYLEWAEQ